MGGEADVSTSVVFFLRDNVRRRRCGRMGHEGVLLQRLSVKGKVMFWPWKLVEGFIIRFPPVARD